MFELDQRGVSATESELQRAEAAGATQLWIIKKRRAFPPEPMAAFAEELRLLGQKQVHRAAVSVHALR